MHVYRLELYVKKQIILSDKIRNKNKICKIKNSVQQRKLLKVQNEYREENEGKGGCRSTIRFCKNLKKPKHQPISLKVQTTVLMKQNDVINEIILIPKANNLLRINGKNELNEIMSGK